MTVTRGEWGSGALSVTWDAVSGATGYNVNYTDDGGQSWERAATKVEGTRTEITDIKDQLPYILAVQAIDDTRRSAWRDSAMAPPECPPAGACITNVAPAPTSSVTLTRADGTVTATWPAADHATSYHVTYTTNGGTSWQLAALNHPATTGENSITFAADNDATYIVGVRARNNTGASNWVNSPPAGPYTPPLSTPAPGAVASVKLSRGDGTVTATWPAAAHATGYHVTYTTDGAQSWQLAALDHAATQGENSITIDGADIRSVTLASLRQQVSIVPQQPFLFTAGIDHNVAYGDPWAGRAAIEHSAATAQLHNYIRKLPTGYSTLVGERGVSLSGGQRQRLSIARGVLPESAVIVFDDSTAAVDAATEQRIHQALHDLTRERAVIIIAHRLRSLLHADEIIFLEEGRIVERGRHEDLLALEGRYRALWDLQASGGSAQS